MTLRKITVRPYERVVAYDVDGTAQVLGPGRHPRRFGFTYVPVDVREQVSTIPGQELLTADGVTVKVSAAVRWSVVDPLAYDGVATDPQAAIYLATQLALRAELGSLTAEELVRQGRLTVARSVAEAAYAAGERVGIAVVDAVIKDVVLPPELRIAYAEVVLARQRGQAQLEAARSETAALRSLANGAKLLDDHPALARLRTVQSAPSGSQLVIKVD